MFKDKKKVRAWIYGVLVAAGPLATVYGFVTADEVVLWLGLGGAVLGIPAGTLAVSNLNDD